MSKLYRARSLLYRRQILQVNIRWKALDEIYKIYMLLHRSDLNISAKFRQTYFFRVFRQKFAKIRYFSTFVIEILMKNSGISPNILENVENNVAIFEFLNNRSKIS